MDKQLGRSVRRDVTIDHVNVIKNSKIIVVSHGVNNEADQAVGIVVPERVMDTDDQIVSVTNGRIRIIGFVVLRVISKFECFNFFYNPLVTINFPFYN